MPTRKPKAPGLFYVDRAGREIALDEGYLRSLGGLERRLLQAHLLHAMEEMDRTKRLTADGPTHKGLTEQPLPLDLSGDLDAIPANRTQD